MYQLTHSTFTINQKQVDEYNTLVKQFPILENKETAEKIFAAFIMTERLKDHQKLCKSNDMYDITKQTSFEVTNKLLHYFAEGSASEFLNILDYNVRKEG